METFFDTHETATHSVTFLILKYPKSLLQRSQFLFNFFWRSSPFRQERPIFAQSIFILAVDPVLLDSYACRVLDWWWKNIVNLLQSANCLALNVKIWWRLNFLEGKNWLLLLATATAAVCRSSTLPTDQNLGGTKIYHGINQEALGSYYIAYMKLKGAYNKHTHTF